MIGSSLNVLRTIGLPSFFEGDSLIDVTPNSLHDALVNKVGLFYLETLAKFGHIDANSAQLSTLRRKHQKTLELTRLVGDEFNKNMILYSIMKTLRPFPYSGADVDVIIGTSKDFSKAVKVLKEQNFTLLGHDLFSATMLRQDFGVNVDLQLEISVSGLPYLNKNMILSHSTDCTIDGVSVKTLAGFSEVVVIACHSFYKEQMYTLADFYSAVLSVTKENSEELCALAQSTNSVVAVSALLAWTRRVAGEAFGVNLPGIDAAFNVLGHHALANLLVYGDLEFPLKFSKPFVILSLMNKIFEDKYARSSLARGLSSSFSRKQFRALINHFNRDSY
jgi:hypothetical protein